MPAPKPRYASVRTLYEQKSSSSEWQVLDTAALVLYFPAPQTVTGEDLLELHVHGGPAVVRAVLAAISRVHSTRAGSAPIIRYAEPGEFTRRAFYNNRLDLTQIEALGDTLSAETEQQRRLAVNGTNNILSKRYDAWRQQLLYARGELEALIDFSEDQHFEESPAKLVSSVAKQVLYLRDQIDGSIKNATRGELLRNGIKIALLGAPNAGKSSLLNRIVGREAAIVSKEAGTTRDVVEINVDIGGFFCKFDDLAGLRKDLTIGRSGGEGLNFTPIGEVEQEGIRRAKQRVTDADVVLIVLSVEKSTTFPRDLIVRVDPEITDTIKKCDLSRQKVIIAINKIDLFEEERKLDSTRLDYLNACAAFGQVDPRLYPFPQFRISCKEALNQAGLKDDPNMSTDPGGIQALLDGLVSVFRSMTSATDLGTGSMAPNALWEESLGASERQRLLLVQCYNRLGEFLRGVAYSPHHAEPCRKDVEDIDIVLAAENLRGAADCLAKITGRGEAGDVEEVLGIVFEK